MGWCKSDITQCDAMHWDKLSYHYECWCFLIFEQRSLLTWHLTCAFMTRTHLKSLKCTETCAKKLCARLYVYATLNEHVTQLLQTKNFLSVDPLILQWHGKEMGHHHRFRTDVFIRKVINREYHDDVRIWKRSPFAQIMNRLPAQRAISVMLWYPPLRWRHNERDSVSNHQPHDCLLNLSFGRRSK